MNILTQEFLFLSLAWKPNVDIQIELIKKKGKKREIEKKQSERRDCEAGQEIGKLGERCHYWSGDVIDGPGQSLQAV